MGAHWNLSTTQQKKVSIIPGRHSRMLLVVIQQQSLDARLRGHDDRNSDTHLCGAVQSMTRRIMGALKKTRILSGALLLGLALIACSQQQPASSTSKKQSSGEAMVSDKANLQGEPAPGGSSESQSQPSSTDKGGRLPVIEKVSLEPRSPATGDQLRAIVQTTNPGGDQVKVVYRWKIDGRAVQESEESVLNSPLHRGEFVELEAIVGNGASSGIPVTTSTFVGNASPTVQFSGQRFGSDNVYQANVEATDPEGGPVKFLLKSGPPGMSVDPATGAVRWAVRPEDTGQSYDVQIVAQDSEGAETLLTYQIKTRMESGEGVDKNAKNVAPSK